MATDEVGAGEVGGLDVGEVAEMVDAGAVRRSALLPASVEAVWAALTDADQLSAWLGGDVELDPLAGGQIAVREDGRLRRGVIVDLEPLRHLEISWLPPSRRMGFLWGPDDEPAGSGGSVEFTLEPLKLTREEDEASGAPVPSFTWLTVIERPPVNRPASRSSALAVA